MTAYIYKIEPICEHDDGDVYIGSTKTTLNERFWHHTGSYRSKRYDCSSYILFDKYGVNNCKIELIEECDEAVRYQREGYWFDNTRCVNKLRPSGLPLNEWKKQYRKENATEINEYNKQYYQDNYEAILEYRSEKYNCECGGKYARRHKSTHLRTKKHTDWQANRTVSPP
jgi:hypothetical protein